MLAKQRQEIILETVNKNRSATLDELCGLIGASESTVRRDLYELAAQGKINKVHGGATAINDSFAFVEYDVTEKDKLFTEEKEAIARYAASLIEDDDFVFIDAGTTTGRMIPYIPEKKAVFVTNGFMHARKLAQRGFKVLVPGGEIKYSTEAIVGTECVISLGQYNFTKSFIGANGVSLQAGFTTPDLNEAKVKTEAVKNSREAYVLADSSKFDSIASVTFGRLNDASIITDKLNDNRYSDKTYIKETPVGHEMSSGNVRREPK